MRRHGRAGTSLRPLGRDWSSSRRLGRGSGTEQCIEPVIRLRSVVDRRSAVSRHSKDRHRGRSDRCAAATAFAATGHGGEQLGSALALHRDVFAARHDTIRRSRSARGSDSGNVPKFTRSGIVWNRRSETMKFARIQHETGLCSVRHTKWTAAVEAGFSGIISRLLPARSANRRRGTGARPARFDSFKHSCALHLLFKVDAYHPPAVEGRVSRRRRHNVTQSNVKATSADGRLRSTSMKGPAA